MTIGELSQRGVSQRRIASQLGVTEGAVRYRLTPIAGTACYFGQDGNMDQTIAIRTLVLRDGICTYQAEAGIVADSDPAREYEDVLTKSAALRQSLALAEKGL